MRHLEQVRIYRDVVESFFDHCVKCLPEEACGVFLGSLDQNVSTAEEFIPITNVDHSETHFTFDQAEFMKITKQVRRKNKKIISVVHSHPKGPHRITSEDLNLLIDPSIIFWSLGSNVDDKVNERLFDVYEIFEEDGVRRSSKVDLFILNELCSLV